MDLAVRDWLLVGLSFTTGIYEAICFLTFGKVFTAAMTGNLVLLGIGVAGTRQPAGPNAVTVVIALAAFAAGAALAMPILKAFNGDKETEDKNVFQPWPRRVSIALAIALVPQVGFLAVWVAAASPASLAYILMALSALAMGLQMNAIRDLHVPGISATAFTATFIDLVSGLVTWSLTAHSAWRLTASIVAMAVGAVLGDELLSHADQFAPVAPLAATAVITAASAMRRYCGALAVGRMSGALPAGARVFSRSTAPPLYYRNNVALDATGVRVAEMADVPGAGGHEEASLAITERYRIR
jgi:uncharacterized membrane protein YoaK (UPF0700 family)